MAQSRAAKDTVKDRLNMAEEANQARLRNEKEAHSLIAIQQAQRVDALKQLATQEKQSNARVRQLIREATEQANQQAEMEASQRVEAIRVSEATKAKEAQSQQKMEMQALAEKQSKAAAAIKEQQRLADLAQKDLQLFEQQAKDLAKKQEAAYLLAQKESKARQAKAKATIEQQAKQSAQTRASQAQSEILQQVDISLVETAAAAAQVEDQRQALLAAALEWQSQAQATAKQKQQSAQEAVNEQSRLEKELSQLAKQHEVMRKKEAQALKALQKELDLPAAPPQSAQPAQPAEKQDTSDAITLIQSYSLQSVPGNSEAGAVAAVAQNSAIHVLPVSIDLRLVKPSFAGMLPRMLGV